MPGPPPNTPDKPLSDLEARFVDEFLIDLDAHHAYLRARGLAAPTKGSKATGYKFRHKPNVIAAIDRAQVARQKRTLIKQDDVLVQLQHIALVDPAEAVDEHGLLKKLTDIPVAHRLAIKAMKLSARPSQGMTLVELTYHDKVSVLLKLLDHLKPKQEGIPLTAATAVIDVKDVATMTEEELERALLRLNSVAAKMAGTGTPEPPTTE